MRKDNNPEFAEIREMLDRRSGEVKSGAVKLIPGEQVEAFFRQKSAAARRTRRAFQSGEGDQSSDMRTPKKARGRNPDSFEETAKPIECDPSEERFDRALREIAKHPPEHKSAKKASRG